MVLIWTVEHIKYCLFIHYIANFLRFIRNLCYGIWIYVSLQHHIVGFYLFVDKHYLFIL